MSDSVSKLARDFAKGHVLFREGDAGSTMYVITTGKVSIEKRLGGAERSVAELGSGEFFGEMAVFNERPRTATATCREDTTCIVLDKKTLESMMSRTPELAMRLIHRLARRLDDADTMVEILMHPDPKARVLLGLKTKVGIAGGVNVDAIARDVGVPVEQVNEVVARLLRLRLAAVQEDGTLKVTDQSRFFEFLEFVESPGPSPTPPRKAEGS